MAYLARRRQNKGVRYSRGDCELDVLHIDRFLVCMRSEFLSI